MLKTGQGRLFIATVCGFLVHAMLLSLRQDSMGKEAYIAHISAQWMDPAITVPVASSVLVLLGVVLLGLLWMEVSTSTPATAIEPSNPIDSIASRESTASIESTEAIASVEEVYITGPGTLLGDRIYKGECRHCGCTFEAGAEWVEEHDDGAYQKVVPCPQEGCGKRVSMSWRGCYEW